MSCIHATLRFTNVSHKFPEVVHVGCQQARTSGALGSKALHVHEGLSVMPSTHCYAYRLNCCSTTHTVLLVLLLGQTITLAAGDATHVMNGSSAQLEDVRLESDGDYNGHLRVTLVYWQGRGAAAPVTALFDVCTSTPHGLWSDVEARVACREMGHVEGEAVPGAGPLQTFARAAVDVRCSSTDTKLSQCTGAYSTAPRTCYPARVICHSHKLEPKAPARSSLYIGVGVTVGGFCLAVALAWGLVRRGRRRAAQKQQGPLDPMPADHGSDAASRLPSSDDRV